jgi:hypothetical protein
LQHILNTPTRRPVVSSQTVSGMTVTESTRDRQFRPTAFEAQCHLAMLILAAVFWLLAALFFWWAGGAIAMAVFGVPIALFVVQLLAHGVTGWRLRATPLVVEPDGRVRYGDGELCPPGSVAAVRIVPDPLSEGDGHKVSLELTTGAAVELPPPYFESFLTHDHARRFADRFAAALGVGVVDVGRTRR